MSSAHRCSSMLWPSSYMTLRCYSLAPRLADRIARRSRACGRGYAIAGCSYGGLRCGMAVRAETLASRPGLGPIGGGWRACFVFLCSAAATHCPLPQPPCAIPLRRPFACCVVSRRRVLLRQLRACRCRRTLPSRRLTQPPTPCPQSA
ncbi:hypothetical protein BU16DRAFT_68189 [Lophium mytilinum]|uniref:Uncharacterized protein n=1 Tax=Lophium mytilinum TaxID=390894 RepID=A0A6A6QP99_9PEZI|nr:hypothetical protein BU16DRAFT_68189 [Lophium mytilinum]